MVTMDEGETRDWGQGTEDRGKNRSLGLTKVVKVHRCWYQWKARLRLSVQ